MSLQLLRQLSRNGQSKTQARNKISEIDDSTNFQIHASHVQLEKPSATASLTFDLEDNRFPEDFVVMEILTEPVIGLHSMKHSSAVIDTMHGVIRFPTLAIQVKVLPGKQEQNPYLSSLTIIWRFHPGQRKQSQPLLITHLNGIQKEL